MATGQADEVDITVNARVSPGHNPNAKLQIIVSDKMPEHDDYLDIF